MMDALTLGSAPGSEYQPCPGKLNHTQQHPHILVKLDEVAPLVTDPPCAYSRSFTKCHLLQTYILIKVSAS